MSPVSGWRTALRMAWREARRTKGRSALVIAMITIPVAALTLLAVRARGTAERGPAAGAAALRYPWLNLGIALLVVPLIAMLGAGLFTRSRLPIERRL